MTAYSFQEGIPVGFASDFEISIFHDPQHLELQSPTGWQSFVLLNNQDRTILGLVYYYAEGTHAASPLRSPFGSFIFSKEVSPQLLDEFVSFVESKLKGRGVKTLLLKNAPEIYAPNEIELLSRVLQESGYQIKQEETSAVIEVGSVSYEKILHRSKKARLNKGYNSEFEFLQLPISRLEEVYNFLKSCRAGKGYSLSMPLVELQKVTNTFLDRFFLHAVTHRDQLIAASISIRVMSTVLYAFYYDHAREFDQASPVVYLCDGLYGFCQERHINLLDLGTSNVEGKLVEPLLNFKLSVGAQPSRKLTFAKNLS